MYCRPFEILLHLSCLLFIQNHCAILGLATIQIPLCVCLSWNLESVGLDLELCQNCQSLLPLVLWKITNGDSIQEPHTSSWSLGIYCINPKLVFELGNVFCSCVYVVSIRCAKIMVIECLVGWSTILLSPVTLDPDPSRRINADGLHDLPDFIMTTIVRGKFHVLNSREWSREWNVYTGVWNTIGCPASLARGLAIIPPGR
jgi:hypothetical protein